MQTALPALFAILAALFFAESANATASTKHQIQILLADSTGNPVVGTTFSGSCKSKEKDSLFAKSVNTDFSCISNEKGICTIELNMLERSPKDWGKCGADDPSYFTEQGKKPMPSVRWLFSQEFPFMRIQNMSGDWNSIRHLSYATYDAFHLGAIIGMDAINRFRNSMDVKDDELEVTATISTEPAHFESGKPPRNAVFVRAFIDKKSLKPTYQIYVRDFYRAGSFRNYNLAKFLSSDGAKAVEVNRIAKDVDCSNKSDGLCEYQETIGFMVHESIIAELAATYKPKVGGDWKFRVSSSAGYDLNQTIKYAELVAVSGRVQDYIATIKK